MESLGGRHITAEDVGIDVNDMEYVYRGPNTSPACTRSTAVPAIPRRSPPRHPAGPDGPLQRTTRQREVGKYSYAVQGLGHVGMEFVKLLRRRGAKVFVTDINQQLVDKAVNEHTAPGGGLDDIYDVAADVYSPCALGGTVNEPPCRG